MRQPGIAALHAVTTTNALRYAYTVSGDDRTRRLLMLQNAAFLPMFRGAMQDRGDVASVTIDTLEPSSSDDGPSPPAIEDIFAELGRDKSAAARMMLARLQKVGDARELIDAARVLVFLKGDDAHDYKFSSAVLEDYYLVSPGLRDKYLASNIFNLASSTQKDNQLVQRTRDALKA
jgi:hypothetical protein